MKIRGLLVAASVFLVLAGLLFWSNRHKPDEATATASPDAPPAILKLDEGAIIKIELKKKGEGPTVLTKSDSGTWQITEPKPLRADQSAISGVVSSLSSLGSDRLVEEKASDLKRYGLDQPSGEVDVTEKNNKTQRVMFGDDTPAGSAVYAMLAGDARVFTVSTYIKNSVDKSINDLRDKRLLPADSDKISRLELFRKNQDIEFARDKDEWQILKPKPLRANSAQVDDLIRKLTDARMDLSGDESQAAAATEFSKANPIATAKITDPSGAQELQIRKNKNTYYARSSAVEGTYKVDADVGDALSKGLDDFRNKKLFDFGFTDPNKIELHSGLNSYLFERNKEDWWSNGKKMDPEAVQSLIEKLRDLSCEKFVDSGFVKPDIQAIVTSNDGKRIEPVMISKSGDHCVAKRENDASLYQLPSNSVDELLKAAEAIKPASAMPAK